MPTPTTHATPRHHDGTRWGDRAGCRGMDLDPFFSSDSEVQLQALRTCNTCPVRMDCLMQALTVEEEHGVWGGMLEADRRALIRERRRTRQAAAEATPTMPRVPAHALVVGRVRGASQPAQAATLAA